MIHFAAICGCTGNATILTWKTYHDVVALPDIVRPMALGFKTDEIQRLFTVGKARTPRRQPTSP